MVSMIFFFNMFLPTLVKAQDDEPPCVGPDPMTGECPIDSGVVFLLIAGAGYGIKKVIDSRKSSAKPDEKDKVFI